jgi:hypothetical protein
MLDDSPAFATFYERHYISAQYAWVRCISDHLADCSRVFGGDLQAMTLLAIIGQVALAKLIQTGVVGPAEFDDPFVAEATNASRLADVTGIPRQTVRRKLAKLQALGWVEQDENAGWRLAQGGAGQAQARLDLAGLENRSIARIGRLIADFDRLAAKDAKQRAQGNIRGEDTADP